jgi:phage/plasmid-like protein (TIGR03299 family)
MGHGLQGRDKMAHRGSKKAIWHAGQTSERLTEIQGDESAEAFAKAAGLDFRMEKVQLDFKGVAVEDIYGIKRDSDPMPLPGVSVGPVYEVLQPSRLVQIGQELREADPALRWDVGGTLFDGRKAWILLKLDGAEIGVERNIKGVKSMDVSIPHLLLSTTFDASQRTIIKDVVKRAICENTLSAAIAEVSPEYWIRHTKSQESKILDAAEALGHATRYFTAAAEVSQELADTPMTLRQAADFFAQIVTGEDELEDAKAKMAKLEKDGTRAFTTAKETGGLMLALFQGSEGSRSNYGQDRYDALNAITEYVDHQRERIRKYRGSTAAKRMDQRFDSTQFGQGSAVKARALRLLTR